MRHSGIHCPFRNFSDISGQVSFVSVVKTPVNILRNIKTRLIMNGHMLNVYMLNAAVVGHIYIYIYIYIYVCI